jgi:arylsulfatase A-like enzyme
MAALRTREWKYVHFTGLEPVLYDLDADPGEMHNIAADPASRDLLAHAAQRMLSWRMAHAERGLTGMVATPNGLTLRAIPARR